MGAGLQKMGKVHGALLGLKNDANRMRSTSDELRHDGIHRILPASSESIGAGMRHKVWPAFDELRHDATRRHGLLY